MVSHILIDWNAVIQYREFQKKFSITRNPNAVVLDYMRRVDLTTNHTLLDKSLCMKRESARTADTANKSPGTERLLDC